MRPAIRYSKSLFGSMKRACGVSKGGVNRPMSECEAASIASSIGTAGSNLIRSGVAQLATRRRKLST